jgi:hypothetical protein
LPKEVSPGAHGNHFPVPQKRLVGRKSGSQRCLLPLTPVRKSTEICECPSRGGHLAIPGSLFWNQFSPSSFHVDYESFGTPLEKKGPYNFHLPRRHFPFGTKPKDSGKTFGNGGRNFTGSWLQNKHKEKHFDPTSKNFALRNFSRPEGRSPGGTSRKTENNQKRIGKGSQVRLFVLQKNRKHFGPGAKLPGSIALPEVGDKYPERFQRPSPVSRLGQENSNPPGSKNPTAGAQSTTVPRFREKFSFQGGQGATFRQFHLWLGGWTPCQEDLSKNIGGRKVQTTSTKKK